MDPFISVSMHPCILHCALKREEKRERERERERERLRLRLKLKPLMFTITGGRKGVILSNHHDSVGGLFLYLHVN